MQLSKFDMRRSHHYMLYVNALLSLMYRCLCVQISLHVWVNTAITTVTHEMPNHSDRGLPFFIVTNTNASDTLPKGGMHYYKVL